MNIKQLQYFVAIAEEGQTTAAAERLHVFQPPLSYELAKLEEELGTKLAKRFTSCFPASSCRLPGRSPSCVQSAPDPKAIPSSGSA